MIYWFRRLSFIILLQALICSTGQTQPHESDPQKATAQPQKQDIKTPVPEKALIEKKAWTQHFQKTLPGHLCQPQLDFLKCYDVTEKACEIYVDMFLEGCMKTIGPKMPDKLTEKESKTFGRIAARCVHDLYRVFLSDKAKSIEGCDSKSKKIQKGDDERLKDPTKPEVADE